MPRSTLERLAHARTSTLGPVRRARRSAHAPRARRRSRRARSVVGDERAADDLARLVERRELAERDRLDEQVADQRRLLRARRAPGARRPRPSSAQSSSLRAPPPTTCSSVELARRSPRASRSTVSACFSARLSRMQRTIAASSCGRGLARSRAQYSAMRAGMSPGSTNDGVVRIDQRAQRAAPTARARRARRTRSRGPRPPTRGGTRAGARAR